MSDDLGEKTEGILNRDRIELMRNEADMCLPASLAEVTTALGGNTQRPHAAKQGVESGGVQIHSIFRYLMDNCQRAGIQIKRILGTEGFIEKISPPDELENKTEVVFGTFTTFYPNIVFMTRDDGVTLHAESQLGDERSKNRIKILEDQGWKVGMVVEFEKIIGSDVAYRRSKF